jgi:RNA polymerase sigma factor (sigma-70 family)
MPAWVCTIRSRRQLLKGQIHSERLKRVLAATEKIFGDTRFNSKQFRFGEMPEYEVYLANKAKIKAAFQSCKDLDMRFAFIEPVLTPAQEQYLFAKYNYLKARARNAALHRFAKRAEKYLRQAFQVREILVMANMRLAITITKGIRSNVLERSVILNEAYFQLLRLIDLFDWTKKVVSKVDPKQKPHTVKFSTFATYGIQRSMWRTAEVAGIKESRYEVLDEESNNIEKDIGLAKERQEEAKYKENKLAIQKLFKHLDDRERRIICLRFGIGCDKHTLKQVGVIEQVSRERIRQIETVAMTRMRFAIQTRYSEKDFEQTCVGNPL